MDIRDIHVLHLSSFDLSGGAARAAYRIHQGLQQINVKSQMGVQFKSSHDPAVETIEGKVLARGRSWVDATAMGRYPNCQQMFSSQWFPDAIADRVAQINPDIINLNWVCNGFLRIETLQQFRQPLVWTLQDMWAFTGGCHYSQGCDRYQGQCGNCPQLGSQRERDLSRTVWQRKAKAWQHLNLTIVTPSQWMAQCAKASTLFRDRPVETIPFGLDTTAFAPVDRAFARQLLNLPQDKPLILFGAIDATSDTRKGFHLLRAALQHLGQSIQPDGLEIVIFGATQPQQPVDLGFKTHYLGKFQDDLSLRMVYGAADVMIAPSIEEAFGQTASESLACGTPVVVFKDTGLMDIVDHQQNGYVADAGDVQDLARGIAWVITDRERHPMLCRSAREKAVQEFALPVQAGRYLKLFERILNQ